MRKGEQQAWDQTDRQQVSDQAILSIVPECQEDVQEDLPVNTKTKECYSTNLASMKTSVIKDNTIL